jgi:hypothetical protein
VRRATVHAPHLRLVDSVHHGSISGITAVMARYVPDYPVAYSRDGRPIYIWEDDAGGRHYVSVRHDGSTFFSDAAGNEFQSTVQNKAAQFAVLGGIVGLLFGAPGVALGALVGAIVGDAQKKSTR